MKKRTLLFALLLNVIFSAFGQDTFSIVAVDPETGAVGSAGATCLDVVQEGASAVIISDIFPGRGAIHTQSYWTAVNQNNARVRFLAGDSPQAVLDWLTDNDVQSNPFIRQYGIADLDPMGNPRAAAYTGGLCMDEKGDRVGETYAIQGNILLSEAVLDSMEARYLNTTGTLAERLMAAMQGANIPGADSRCLAEGVSSRSAFLRVALPDDPPNDILLDLRVDATPFGLEPIDSLQALFDAWLVTGANDPGSPRQKVRVFPNPAFGQLTIQAPPGGRYQADLRDATGRPVWQARVAGGAVELPPLTGLFILQVRDAAGRLVYTGRQVLLSGR